MAAVNAPLASSGFVGALTSVLVDAAGNVFPDNNMKSLAAVGADMLAALLWFDLMNWFVVLRLRATKRSLDAILPQFEAIDAAMHAAIERQVEGLRQRNAPASSIQKIEKERNEVSSAIASSMMQVSARAPKCSPCSTVDQGSAPGPTRPGRFNNDR